LSLLPQKRTLEIALKLQDITLPMGIISCIEVC
jgi:hypothetical protein